MENETAVKQFAEKVNKALRKIPFTYDEEGYAVVLRSSLFTVIEEVLEELREGKQS